MLDDEPIKITKDDINSLLGPEVEGSFESLIPGEIQTPSNNPTNTEKLIILPSDLGDDITTLIIPNEAAFKISIEEFLVPLDILEPKDGQEISQRTIDIVGKTKPGAWLRINLNDVPGIVTESGEDGVFRFMNIKLADGDNKIAIDCVDELTSLAQPVVLHIRLKLPPYIGLRDWYTRERLELGSDVVRCKKCDRYVLRITWNAEGCYCGEKGDRFFTPDQPEFSQVKDQTLRIT